MNRAPKEANSSKRVQDNAEGRIAKKAEGGTVGGWVPCSLDDPWPSEWRPSNLSSQGQQKQNHIVTVGKPILPQLEAHIPLPYRSQLPQKFYWWFFETVPGRE